MRYQFHTKCLLGIAISGAMLFGPIVVQAQIEEIVVTAQKREQNLQDVPIAVTAFTAETIKEKRINDLQEIAIRTPSFNIGQNGPTAPELTIRGVGSTDREAGSDRSVVVFVDEVYIGRAGSSTFDLFDLERIEVLRGPQGSIFGRNVVGGSVNLITANPTFEPSASLSLSGGNLDLLEAKGHLTGRVTDTTAARIAFSTRSRDGYYNNRQFDSRTAGDTQSLGVRGKLLFAPNDDFKAVVTVDASHDEMNGVASAITQGATSDAEYFAEFANRFATNALPSVDPLITDNNEFGFMDRDIIAVSARLDWDTSIGTVIVIPAVRDSTFEIVRDLVGISIADPGAPFVSVDSRTEGFSTGIGFESTAINEEDYTAASLEARIASMEDGNSRLSWLAGVYYLDESVHRDQIRERNLSQSSNGNAAISRPLFQQRLNLSSIAGFGQIRWDFTDRLGVAVGGRYTRDDKDFGLTVSDTLSAADQAAILAVVPNAVFSLSPAAAEFSTSISETFSEFTPELTLDFQLNDDVMVYAKASTGFKSGGFVGLGATEELAQRSFDKETVTNLELGLKGMFFDRRLQLNADIFTMDFEDLQLRDRQLLIPGDETSAIVTTVNAAEAEISGFEADFVFNPVSTLNISGSLSLLDTEVVAISEGSTVILGSQLPKAPETSGNIALDYTFEGTGRYEFKVGTDVQFTDSQFFDINEDTAGTEPSYSLWNAAATFGPTDGNWSVSFWGKNLGDEQYRTQIQSAFGDDVGIISTVGVPRTYGVTFNMSFLEN